MRRHRIKKLPPINFIQFGILVGLCGVAYLSPNKIVISAFLLILMVCVIDGIHFFVVKRALRLYVNGGVPVEKGEIFNINVKFVNKSNLPACLFHVSTKSSRRLNCTEKNEITTLLAPMEKYECAIKYEARLSGEDIVGIEWGRLDSVFGFFRLHLPLEMYVRVRVLPGIKELRGIERFIEVLAGSGEEDRNGNIEEEKRSGEEIGYELRPYQEGDSQRLIHWKLAALKEVYLVRQREGSNHKGQDIFLIICPLQYKKDEEAEAVIQDRTVTSALSVAYYFLSHEQTVKVACYINKSWKYIELTDSHQIRSLQEMLSKYGAVILNEKVDEKAILKSLFKVIGEENSIKILISAYCSMQMSRMFLSSGEEKQLSMLYTDGKAASNLTGEMMMPIWQVREDYWLEQIY